MFSLVNLTLRKTSKPECRLTGGSVRFRAVSISLNNDNRPGPDVTGGQPAVEFWSRPLTVFLVCFPHDYVKWLPLVEVLHLPREFFKVFPQKAVSCWFLYYAFCQSWQIYLFGLFSIACLIESIVSVDRPVFYLPLWGHPAQTHFRMVCFEKPCLWSRSKCFKILSE